MATTTTDFSEQQEMLCLSGITYRNFGAGGAGWIHGQDLHTTVAEGLTASRVTRNRWDLVWGPVSYRAPFSLVDDALMYVVRRREDPSRCAVVIRGTNPISVFDWIFGDLWVTVQMPWPYGSAPRTAKISVSTALGLGLLQSMHSPPPPKGLARKLWTALDEGAGSILRQAGGTLFDRISAALDPASIAAREALAPFIDALTAAQHGRADRVRRDPLAAVVDSWKDSLQRSTLREVVRLVNAVTERYSGLAFAALQMTTANPGPGVSLLEFLRAARDEAGGKLDVMVTGHSKGGALASTVALWLHDTQGTDVPASEQWDPGGQATVRCHSFAGPTAGNAAFAAHSNRALSGVCTRFVNTNDLVPHAWALADVQNIAKLWDGTFDRAPLRRLVDQVTRDLDTLHLEYTHPDVLDHFTVPSPEGAQILELFAFHHFGAYFVGLDLCDQMDPIAMVVRP